MRARAAAILAAAMAVGHAPSCVEARLVPADGSGGGGEAGAGGGAGGAGGAGGCVPPPAFYKRDLVLVAGNSDTFVFMFDALYDETLDAYALRARCIEDRETPVVGGWGWFWFDVDENGMLSGASGLRGDGGGGGQAGQGGQGGAEAGYVHIPAKGSPRSAPFEGQPITLKFRVQGRACLEGGRMCAQLGSLEVIEPFISPVPIALTTLVRPAPLTGSQLTRAIVDPSSGACVVQAFAEAPEACPICSHDECDTLTSPDPACSSCLATCGGACTACDC